MSQGGSVPQEKWLPGGDVMSKTLFEHGASRSSWAKSKALAQPRPMSPAPVLRLLQPGQNWLETSHPARPGRGAGRLRGPGVYLDRPSPGSPASSANFSSGEKQGG